MNTPQSKRVSPRAIPALALLCGGLWLIAPSSGAAQGVKDLMGKAQTQSDQRAVDELIRKLKGGATASIPTTLTATRPSAPIELPAVRKSEESVAVDPKQPILPADLQQSPVVALPVPPQVEPPLQPAAIVMPPAASPSPVDVARTEALPAVDIEVYFDTRSDAVTARAEATLMLLGKALSDPRLAGVKFLIAGHTDAAGSALHNRALSERRAASVRRFLIEQFGIEEGRLVSRGFGFDQLKLPGDPKAVENRRVQIVNLSASAPR